jgi:hypothetical protein
MEVLVKKARSHLSKAECEALIQYVDFMRSSSFSCIHSTIADS